LKSIEIRADGIIAINYQVVYIGLHSKLLIVVTSIDFEYNKNIEGIDLNGGE